MTYISNVAIGIAIVAILFSGAILIFAISNQGMLVPIGTILPWAGSSIPNGYLIADGSEVKVNDFPYLFNVIARTYGSTTDESFFRLPDLSDTFIRGTAVNSGVTGGTASHDHSVDPPLTPVKGDGAHTHSVNPPAKESGFEDKGSRTVSFNPLGTVSTVADDKHRHTTNIGSFTTGSSTHGHDVNIGTFPTETAEHEPPYLSLVMIIRAN